MTVLNAIVWLFQRAFAWAAGLLSLSALLMLALPFGGSAAKASVYHVLMPQAAAQGVLHAAQARLIDHAPAFAQTHRYTISADPAVGPAALYRAGAWLVLSGQPTGCGPVSSS